MAHTKDDILKILQAAKDADSTLSGLSSESATAEYKLWQEVYAGASVIIEQFIEEKEADIKDTVDRGIAPNSAWLDKILRAFQDGDTLEINAEGKPYYPVVDAEKQIIKRVAIIEGQGTYRAKVAGEDESGEIVTLTVGQVYAINVYLDRYILGNPGTAESKDPDYIKIQYDIYFPALKTEAVIKPLVIAAMEAYLRVLDFGGTFYLSKLEDAIQSVDPTIDFRRTLVQARTNAGAFGTVSRTYIPDAGYIAVDPAFSLEDNLNFIPV